MNAPVLPNLTDRQRDVLERVDRRVPIKVIAGDLGLSEARINQHIRTLKDKFECESMNELVEQYRSFSIDKTKASPEKEGSEEPYSNSLYRNTQLPDEPIFPDQGSRVDPGKITFADAHHVLIDAPWTKSREPVVVPQTLDGDNAVLRRLAAMIGIAFGIVAAVILVAAAAVTVSEILDGKASLRTETPDS